MPVGSVTRSGQTLPVTSATQGVGTVGSSLTGLDNTEIPYVILVDENDPSAKPNISKIAQDGTDSSDANATQATAGVGIRGWLSTLVSLFRAGTAKVTIANSGASQMVPVNPRLLTTSDTVSIGPATTTGATTYEFNNTGVFTVQTIKNAAGTLYALELTVGAAAASIAVYDVASPTPGTTAPKIIATAPANTTICVPMGTAGRAFATAITVFVSTTLLGATGTAANGAVVTAAYF